MRIDFYNRDGFNIWLERVGENSDWWQLRTDQSSLFDYINLTFEDNDTNSIYAVDPPGGPFISIGSKWWCGSDEELEVKEIKNTSLGVFLKLAKTTT